MKTKNLLFIIILIFFFFTTLAQTSPLKKGKLDIGEFNKDIVYKADEKRDKAIELLQKIIKKTRNLNEKANLLLRLAELYWEKARALDFELFLEYETKHKKWETNKKRGSEPILDTRSSNQFRQKAINIYRSVIKRYKTFDRKDFAFFHLGVNLHDMGQTEKAFSTFRSLVTKYPNSSYIGDARFYMGEYYFNKIQIHKAIAEYKKVLALRNPKSYGTGLYKLGWCYYNLNDFTKAIETFKKVVSFSEKQTELASSQKISLKEEALNDLIRIYVELGEIESAEKYFIEIGGDEYYKKLLKKLGDAFTASGDYDKALSTYDRFLEVAALHPDAPTVHKAKIDLIDKLHEPQKAVQELSFLKKLYFTKSLWYKKNRDNSQAIESANLSIEGIAKKIAVKYHKEAQNKKSKNLYTLALKAYQIYLDLFPESKESYNIRFFIAEIQYFLKNYRKACPIYDDIHDDPSIKTHKVDAAYALIHCYGIYAYGDKVNEEKSKSLIKDKDIKNFKQKDIREIELKIIAVTDSYVSLVKNKKKLPKNLAQIEFNAARIFYKYNHFDEAKKRFFSIIKSYPKSDLATLSATLIIDSYVVRKDWNNVIKYSNAFYSKKSFGDDKFRKHIRDLMEGVAFKGILAKEEDLGPAELASEFESFGKKFLGSIIEDKALYNSVINYNKAGDISNTLRTSTLFVKKFSKSSALAPEIFFIRAKAYEKTCDFELAANQYRILLTNFPKYSKKKKILQPLTLLDNTIRNPKHKIATINIIAKQNKRSSKIPYMYLDLGKIHYKNKKYTEAIKVFNSIIRNYKTKGAVFEAYAYLAIINFDQKKYKNTGKLIRTASKQFSTLSKNAKSRQVENFAHIKFIYAELAFNNFNWIKLRLPYKKLKASLKKKANALAYTKTKFTEVIELGQKKWTIASLYKIGESYQKFAESLFGAPIPKGLNKKQAEEYRLSLEEQAFPVEDKAIMALEQCLTKSIELSIYSKWGLKALAALIKYKPNEYISIPELNTLSFELVDLFSHHAILDPQKFDSENYKSSGTRKLIKKAKVYIYDSNPNYKEAEKLLKKALRLDVLDVNAFHYLAYANLMSGKYKKAISIYKDILKIDFNDKVAIINSAMAYAKLGKIQDAFLKFKSFIIKYDKDVTADILLNYAMILNKKKHFKSSRNILRKSIIKNPTNVFAYRLYARTFVEMGNFDLASLALMVAMERNPAIINFDLANLYGMQNDLTNLKIYLDKAISSDPDFEPAYEKLGLMYLLFRNYRASIHNIGRIRYLDPESAYLLAIAYLGQKDYNNAKKVFLGLFTHPKIAKKAKFQLAIIYFENLEQYEESKRLFSEIRRSFKGKKRERIQNYLKKIELKMKSIKNS